MRKYEPGSIGSLLDGDDSCLAPRFTLRRRIAAALFCGCSAKKNLSRPANKKSSSLLQPAPTPSQRLSDLLHAESSESDSEIDDSDEANAEAFDEFNVVVKRLQCDEYSAANDVRRLARDNPTARNALGRLGAIPPLVSMLEPEQNLEVQIAALYGLLNLGIGNDRNKEEIVSAGTVHRMMDLVVVGCSDEVSDAIAANFLGLTALDANKAVVGAASGAIAFLVQCLGERRRQVREDALRALYNISLAPCNVKALVEAGAVAAAVGAMGEKGMKERALAVLASLVGTVEGRLAVGEWLGEVAEVLEYGEEEGCQEKAAYVMMVMAHGGYGEWVKAVAEGGLLEVALVGTPLAQRRATRALELARVGRRGRGKGVVVGEVSAPQYRAAVVGGAWGGEERTAVKEMVQQSLQMNMRRIVRRANLAVGKRESGEQLRAIAAASGSSKSLPF